MGILSIGYNILIHNGYVHWTSNKQINSCKNVHPCPLGPMDTLCPFLVHLTCPLDTLDVHCVNFIVPNGHNYQTLFGNYGNISVNGYNGNYGHNGHNCHDGRLMGTMDTVVQLGTMDTMYVQWTFNKILKSPSMSIGHNVTPCAKYWLARIFLDQRLFDIGNARWSCFTSNSKCQFWQ